jgi:hypothetical protein
LADFILEPLSRDLAVVPAAGLVTVLAAGLVVRPVVLFVVVLFVVFFAFTVGVVVVSAAVSAAVSIAFLSTRFTATSAILTNRTFS